MNDIVELKNKCGQVFLKSYEVENKLVWAMFDNKERVDFADELVIEFMLLAHENMNLFINLNSTADKSELEKICKKLSENHIRLIEIDRKIRAKFKI